LISSFSLFFFFFFFLWRVSYVFLCANSAINQLTRQHLSPEHHGLRDLLKKKQPVAEDRKRGKDGLLALALRNIVELPRKKESLLIG